MKWYKSFTPIDQFGLAESVHEGKMKLFDFVYISF